MKRNYTRYNYVFDEALPPRRTVLDETLEKVLGKLTAKIFSEDMSTEDLELMRDTLKLIREFMNEFKHQSRTIEEIRNDLVRMNSEKYNDVLEMRCMMESICDELNIEH